MLLCRLVDYLYFYVFVLFWGLKFSLSELNTRVFAIIINCFIIIKLIVYTFLLLFCFWLE